MQNIDANWSDEGEWGKMHQFPVTRDVRQTIMASAPAPEALRREWNGAGYWGEDAPNLRDPNPNLLPGRERAGSSYCMLDKAVTLSTPQGPAPTHCVKRNGSLGYELTAEKACVNAPSCNAVSWYARAHMDA